MFWWRVSNVFRICFLAICLGGFFASAMFWNCWGFFLLYYICFGNSRLPSSIWWFILVIRMITYDFCDLSVFFVQQQCCESSQSVLQSKFIFIDLRWFNCKLFVISLSNFLHGFVFSNCCSGDANRNYKRFLSFCSNVGYLFVIMPPFGCVVETRRMIRVVEGNSSWRLLRKVAEEEGQSVAICQKWTGKFCIKWDLEEFSY